MAAVTFDTFEAVQNLQAAGMDERAAKAVVDTVKRSLDDSQVATKTDLMQMQIRLMVWMAVMTGLGVAVMGVMMNFMLPGAG